MVIFGRFQKPKSPIVLGSPEEDDIIPPQTPATPQVSTSPVPRNFSYPSSVVFGNRTPTHSNSARPGQSAWDQLGEICSFSPDSPSRAATAGSEDPFFYKSDRNEHTVLTDEEDRRSTSIRSRQLLNNRTVSKVEPAPRKKQRRSVLLGLSVPQSQDTSLLSRTSDLRGFGDKKTKAPKVYSLGDHIFPHKTKDAARSKRNSLSQHKAVASFDASQSPFFRSASLERPASSSGVPVVDSRLRHSSSIIGPSLTPYEVGWETSAASGQDTAPLRSQQLGKRPDMDFKHRKSVSQSINGQSSSSSSGRNRSDSAAGPEKRKEKDGKGRWLSHIKDWVFISEPGKQALKTYKKDAYKRAGVSPKDPLANAKLRISAATLPPEAIKPSGPGPEPEEIARRKAEHKKKTRQSYQTMGGTSTGSRTTASQLSSMSSLPLYELREDV
ncbi:hypothetical protein BJ170DRAFT_685171 [Xylariales sp. AK1849]|nr:hypothetical protein BJ170DRAFT_685171 [Xylariales sp. AK1849]